jgi:hypothetical protein
METDIILKPQRLEKAAETFHTQSPVITESDRVDVEMRGETKFDRMRLRSLNDIAHDWRAVRTRREWEGDEKGAGEAGEARAAMWERARDLWSVQPISS